MANLFAAPSFLRTSGLVCLAIAVLFGTDMFLAKMERKETRIEAGRLFRQGQALMQRGDNAQAIERIRDAMAIERGNRNYQRTLAEAQLAAGAAPDAESTLADLLQSDSTDSPASLIMGRVLAKEGRFPEAVSYFRRAIYGYWDQDAVANQLRARFELIDLLVRQNSKEELLAELLPMQDQAPGDLTTQMRLGRLFLQAGSPTHAAGVFRAILREAPANAEAHAGLGEAEFARGNYRAAERDFQTALRLSPADRATRERLDLCTQLLMLDPMARDLTPAERFERSRKLLALTLDDAGTCGGENPSSEMQELLDIAAKVLRSRVPASRRSEVSESNLDLAEQLWQACRKECKTPPATDSPLALVLARIAR